MKNIRQILKDGLTAEKEAQAITDAIQSLTQRHGFENRLTYEFAEELSALKEKEVYILKAIKSLQDPTLKAIFTKRYIKKMRWEDIAQTEYISQEHLLRLHRKGLEQLESA